MQVDCSKDNYESKIYPETTSNVQVSYNLTYKKLTIGNQMFIFYLCDKPGNEGGTDTTFIKVPLSDISIIVANDATDDDGFSELALFGFMERLNLLDTIKYVSPIGNITTPCLDSTKLSDTPTTTNISVPFLQLLHTQTTPLGRSELGYYLISSLFHIDLNDQFTKIKDSYNCNVNNDGNPEIVLWMGKRNDGWSIADLEYKKALVKDSGSEMLSFTDNLNNDALKPYFQQADVIVDDTFSHGDKYDNADFGVNAGIAAEDWYGFMKYGGKLLRWDKLKNSNGVNDFQSQIYARPDIMLKDLVFASNPGVDSSDYKKVYVRNIANDDPYQTISTCQLYPATNLETIPCSIKSTPSSGNTSNNNSQPNFSFIGLTTVLVILLIIGVLAWWKRTVIKQKFKGIVENRKNDDRNRKFKEFHCEEAFDMDIIASSNVTDKNIR